MNDLVKHLFSGARPFFEERGFQYRPAVQQFRREAPGGFQCVIFSATAYADTVVFEAHLGIRLESVEGLAFPYTNGLPGFSADSMTLVTPAARLRGKRFERRQLDSLAAADAALAATFRFLEADGLPFLNRYSDLPAMDELYNSEPMRPLDLVHNQTNRCLRGVTLARLAGRDDFDRLVRIYRQQLNILHAPDFAVRKYEELVRFLRSYSPN